MYLPRDFPKWDNAVDGLEDAGRWALDYERSLLPASICIPRTGQIWETRKDCEVQFRAHIDLPPPLGLAKGPVGLDPALFGVYVMQFGTAILRQGERVRILELQEPKPISIAFVPVRYEELHEHIIPAKVRALSTYQGRYELSVKIARTISDFQGAARQSYFSEDFHLVEDVP